MDEGVRDLWVTSLHYCGEIEQAMRNVTKTSRESSEQHVELGSSRCQRDFSDLKKMCQWIEESNPFDTRDPRLRSLSTGLAASESHNINCHLAEEAGQEIQESMDNKTYVVVKVPTSKKVKTLSQLTKSVKIGSETVHIE